MRRALPLSVLVLALAGCASPRAELQDAVAELTDAVNAGSPTDTVREADEVITLAEQQREDLGTARTDRIVQYAQAVRGQAEALRPAPVAPLTPSATPTPEPEPVETTPEPEPEPVETTPEPEPTPEEPEPEPTTPEPEPEEEETEEPDDGGITILPTRDGGEQTPEPEAAPATSAAGPTPGATNASVEQPKGKKTARPTEQPA